MGNLTSNATSSQALADTVAAILGIGELYALAHAALDVFMQQHLHVSGPHALPALQALAGPVCNRAFGPKPGCLSLVFMACQHQVCRVAALHPPDSSQEHHE